MNESLKNLKQAASQILLSQTEKDDMRAQIFERIDASKRAQKATQAKQSPYTLFIFSLRSVVSLSLVLVVLVGSGTAYAAGGALPGEVLYPVKVYVNENVQEVLAVSDQAKLSYHTQIAEVRLEEAEELASQGKLGASNTAEIEVNLHAHVAEADAIAQKIEDKDPGEAAPGAVELDSSLAAHTAILARLGGSSKDDSTRENSRTLALNVRIGEGGEGVEKGGGVAALKVAPEATSQVMTMSLAATDTQASSSEATSTVRKSFNANATVAQRKVALLLQTRAESKVEDAEDTYEYLESYLPATTSAKVKAGLAELKNQMEVGEEQMDAKQYEDARATFTEVIRKAVELKANIQASKMYKRDFLWGDDQGEVRGAETESSTSDTKENRKGKGDKKGSTIEVNLGL
jgi:hypothetical protein